MIVHARPRHLSCRQRKANAARAHGPRSSRVAAHRCGVRRGCPSDSSGVGGVEGFAVSAISVALAHLTLCVPGRRHRAPHILSTAEERRSRSALLAHSAKRERAGAARCCGLLRANGTTVGRHMPSGARKCSADGWLNLLSPVHSYFVDSPSLVVTKAVLHTSPRRAAHRVLPRRRVRWLADACPCCANITQKRAATCAGLPHAHARSLHGSVSDAHLERALPARLQRAARGVVVSAAGKDSASAH